MTPENIASVDQLLHVHFSQIQQILFKFPGLDEIWVLRHILNDPAQAEQNIRKALEWRKQNAQTLEFLANGGTLRTSEILKKYVKRGVCGWLNDQYLLYVVRAGQADPAGLCREVSHEELIQAVLLENDRVFRLLEDHTRITRKICQLITVIDLQGFSMRRFDRRFAKANGESSNLSSIYFPQFLKTVVLINLPSTFRILFSFTKMFMSKQALDKNKLCPAKTKYGNARDCPYLRQFDPQVIQIIPYFLGGELHLPLLDIEKEEEGD